LLLPRQVKLFLEPVHFRFQLFNLGCLLINNIYQLLAAFWKWRCT
jgi:hypothetical protein